MKPTRITIDELQDDGSIKIVIQSEFTEDVVVLKQAREVAFGYERESFGRYTDVVPTGRLSVEAQFIWKSEDEHALFQALLKRTDLDYTTPSGQLLK